MKIIVDAFGGDYAPEEIVSGCILALKKYEDLIICLTGDKEELTKVLLKNMFSSKRLEIADAKEIITNDETPTVAIKKKTNSSLVVAFDLLKTDSDAIGMLSAGSTGAVLTGAFLKIGRLDGVSRPSLSPVLPTWDSKGCMLLDVGANVDCKPINLLHFAYMGNEYMKALGRDNPRLGLLNIGTEEHKGNELTKETYALLKQSKLNFIGNVEAREIMSGNVDVVVADGFAGNIALKSAEGLAKNMLKALKLQLTSSFSAKIGALLIKKKLKKVKDMFDYNLYGGAPLLGLKKIVIKSHGDSKAETILRCIDQILLLNEKKLCEHIATAVSDEKVQ